MKKLYLLRHATTEQNSPSGDFGRELTAAGTKEAITVGQHIKNHLVLPDITITSPASRTMRTAEKISTEITQHDKDQKPVQEHRGLYLSDAKQILEYITGANNQTNCLLVIAHNPGISALAHHLSNGTLSDHITEYAPATLSVFSANITDWSILVPDLLVLESVFCPSSS